MTEHTRQDWTVFASSVNGVLQAAEQLGADRHQLLKAAAIEQDLLSQSDNRFPVAALFKLYELADHWTGTPDIGIYSGRISYVVGLNIQLYMTTICETFRDYLNFIPSVLKMHGDIGEVKVGREKNFLRLEWHPLSKKTGEQRYLSDCMMTFSAAIVDSLCVQPVPVIKACFSYPRPADTALLEQTFGSDLEFGQAMTCLYFDMAVLNYPLIHLDYAVGEALLPSVRRLFEDSESPHSFLARLRQSIMRLLPAGEMSIDKVAAELNVSRRTLQRRLSERDTHFLQVLQDVRSGLAERYLADKRLGITQIAFLLGYTDQASFSSAFKSWHGKSPSEYRQL